MLPRAARPERPERLSPLRPPAPGRRALSSRVRLLLLPLLVAAAIAGCGGDDEPAGETTRELPDLSITTETTPTVTTPVEPPATETTVDPATETLPEEGPPPEPEQPPADSPDSDTPPPEDSPAERFEEYCNENPGACG
jgi:outer membrane biosynthesis protein TonB